MTPATRGGSGAKVARINEASELDGLLKEVRIGVFRVSRGGPVLRILRKDVRRSLSLRVKGGVLRQPVRANGRIAPVTLSAPDLNGGALMHRRSIGFCVTIRTSEAGDFHLLPGATRTNDVLVLGVVR